MAQKKGFFRRFLEKFQRDPRNNHTFSDEDREIAELKREENKLRKQRLDDLKDRLKDLSAEFEERRLEDQIARTEEKLGYYEEDDDDDEEELNPLDAVNNPDAMLFNLLSQILTKGSGSTHQTPTTNQYTPTASAASPPPRFEEISDDEIKKILSQFSDREIKIARSMPKETLIKMARARYPGVSDRSLDRAMEMIHK